MQGIIIENLSGIYKIKSNDNTYNSTARGIFRKNTISPIVGDIVDFTVLEEKNAIIEKIHKRKTYIKRPKISNITQIILVVSLKDPNPDLLLLDKQLVFAEYSDIRPIIVFNKVDLCSEQHIKEINSIYETTGYKILQTEAKNREGIEELKNVLKGNINAFAGNSGVGKSTLINAIFNEEKTLEGDLSQKSKKGKNTTTSVKLFELDTNTFIADTPGFSTFDIFEIDYKNLDKYFIEFQNEISNCRYIGCTHIKEDYCGIKKAVEEERINNFRYNNYCKIYNELKNCIKY